MSFSDSIRTQLSIDAGGFCANPDCRAPTGYFLKGATKSAGDGAHIVAENSNGPRGNSQLSPYERSLASNGVWLCPNCHRKVDILQPQQYSILTLQQWKENATSWWQQNQGKPLQVVARPDERAQVARPTASSLNGAQMFLNAHRPLADALWNLRFRQSDPFRSGVAIPDDTERKILQMSKTRRIGLSWQDEWATTYHCEDKELLNYMTSLIQSADAIQRPPGTILDGQRYVNFKQPDYLASLISEYLSAFERLQNCTNDFKRFGL